jgi:hypothetical protein
MMANFERAATLLPSSRHTGTPINKKLAFVNSLQLPTGIKNWQQVRSALTPHASLTARGIAEVLTQLFKEGDRPYRQYY